MRGGEDRRQLGIVVIQSMFVLDYDLGLPAEAHRKSLVSHAEECIRKKMARRKAWPS
jgi:hypothetical protein